MAMLRVANCPSQDLALTNAAFVHDADSAFVPYAELGDLVLFTRPHPDVERGTIALNGVQRKLLRVSTGDTLRVEPFTLPSTQFNAAAMTVELEFTKLRTATDLNAAGRHEQVRKANCSPRGSRADFQISNILLSRTLAGRWKCLSFDACRTLSDH
jgi:vesicle-fusing ATPase